METIKRKRGQQTERYPSFGREVKVSEKTFRKERKNVNQKKAKDLGGFQ